MTGWTIYHKASGAIVGAVARLVAVPAGFDVIEGQYDSASQWVRNDAIALREASHISVSGHIREGAAVLIDGPQDAFVRTPDGLFVMVGEKVSIPSGYRVFMLALVGRYTGTFEGVIE